ncbi:uncharacterized protein LOC133718299 [Rosa rugosa]|uniref:uncharacterized protein LOC133718299 n=1 Tax=Rosa rugosa TaxID=74645 RepID=UPI002B40CA56|nr:uncharacterized protein LOC133718299 [Rosa rugosa]
MGGFENPYTSSVSSTMAALQKRIIGRRSKPLNATVSTQEFNSFHTIDRKLFTRLVFSLGRDPTESAQVMALWMWLEHNGNEFNLVYKALMTLPNTLLNAMADESVSALNCIQSNVFPFSDSGITPDIPMLQAMSNSGVTLRFFHESRGEIASGVITLLKDVCLRVFGDLLFQPHLEKKGGDGLYNPVMGDIAQGNVQWGNDIPLYWHPQMNSANLYYLRGGFDPHKLAVQRQNLNEEMEEVLSRLNLNDHQDQEVFPQDRTIFLTFSRGFPIAENKLREFFTRRFGEIIDVICMQEAKEPLYARLVLQSASSIPVVLGGKSMVQFCIDGRHVRARKFVLRHACAGQRRD